MRSAIGILAVGVTIVGGAAMGIHTVLAPVPGEPQAAQSSAGSAAREAGVSGEQNSLQGTAKVLIVNVGSDNVLEAFAQARDAGQQLRLVSDKRYSVVVDPALPMDSVTIIEAKSGDILDSFPVSSQGQPPR